MKLEETEVATIVKAIDVYLRVAWGEQASAKRPKFDFASASNLTEALEGFTDDRRTGKMRKWVLRLGNPHYPFMKIVFQELLVRDRFFFAVDTHDDLELEDGARDFEKWLGIRRANAELREEIERAWLSEGIPTFATVVAEIERETRKSAQASVPNGRAILVVDDDVNIAAGVESVLIHQGYRVTKVHNVEDALEALKRDVPDIILSDLEMPGRGGLDLARAVRSDPRTAGTPFILATAASIDSTHFRLIDGYLVKPFETDVLLTFVEQHLNDRRRGGDSPPAGKDKWNSG